MAQDFYLKRFEGGHVHLREPGFPWCQNAFEKFVKVTADQCRHAVVMPNLETPITTFNQMWEYMGQIDLAVAKVSPRSVFRPLMTMYLTENSSEDDIKRAAESPCFAGWKLYPQGLTTNSQQGTADFRKLERVLRYIEEVGSRLLIHGETPIKGIDRLDAEEMFVSQDLPIIRQMFGGRMCLEHCSTPSAINAVLADDLMYGSITPHHLTGNDLETYDNPFKLCKPVWQTEEKREEVLTKVMHGRSKKFFAGTDSAPQLTLSKLAAFPPFGCFSEPVALQLYFQAFLEAYGDLSRDKCELLCEWFNDFLFNNMARFYGLPIVDKNISTMPFDGAVIHVSSKASIAPSAKEFSFFDPIRRDTFSVTPLRAGETLSFSVEILT